MLLETLGLGNLRFNKELCDSDVDGSMSLFEALRTAGACGQSRWLMRFN